MAGDKPVDPELVRELTGILRDGDLTEIEIETDGEETRIRLSRGAVAGPMAIAAPVQAPPVAPSAPASEGSGEQQAASSSGMSGRTGDVITSPMVGTAYLSPSPGAAQFVAEGQTVKEGDTILIIEAMKVMNQIPAPRSGKVVEILCENGQPVEFDQPLIVLE